MMNTCVSYNNFDKYPEKFVSQKSALSGWDNIIAQLNAECKKGVLVAEIYPGANVLEIASELQKLGGKMLNAEDFTISNEAYHKMTDSLLTDDRVFGVMNTLTLESVYLPEAKELAAAQLAPESELTVIYGTGASLLAKADCLVYFDMPRWEIQCRFKKGMPNWKTQNEAAEQLVKFKQGYFLEWRMADRVKRKLLNTLDYIVDTVLPYTPKMIAGGDFRKGLELFSSEPFRLVPYYAPEVWGGQWMKEVCGLDKAANNFAWAFDGVPEENSIYMRFGEVRMEFPSINVVFFRPKQLLGNHVHARFGDEFPIRFDFLDTMGGQNLSLQVHPLTEYIQNTFGMHYTQDESYYVLDAGENAVVYLGLKENIRPAEMLAELKSAQEGSKAFDAQKFVNIFPAKKHDHFLIPAGTVHCSGKNTMVLEISATPYIFTFKLWDWGRLGLNGKPRPVHLQHGSNVIQWDRTTAWVEDNLINRFEVLEDFDDFTATKTGLHEREFIETHRYNLSTPHTFKGEKSVSMCNVVDGSGAVISSPCNAFAPYTVHFAETFIIPASIQEFTIKPLDKDCMIIRATVR